MRTSRRRGGDDGDGGNRDGRGNGNGNGNGDGNGNGNGGDNGDNDDHGDRGGRGEAGSRRETHDPTSEGVVQHHPSIGGETAPQHLDQVTVEQLESVAKESNLALPLPLVNGNIRLNEDKLRGNLNRTMAAAATTSLDGTPWEEEEN